MRKAAKALQSDRLDTFGGLMTDSHASLRDLYEVSSEPLDHLVNAALDTEGTLGSRLTGAGFGGCTVSLVNTGDLERWMQQVSERYTKNSGRQTEFFAFRAADGVCRLPLDSLDSPASPKSPPTDTA